MATPKTTKLVRKPKPGEKKITTDPIKKPTKPVVKDTVEHQRAVARNIQQHKSTAAQRAANIKAHQSTPAQRLANKAHHTPTPKPPAGTKTTKLPASTSGGGRVSIDPVKPKTGTTKKVPQSAARTAAVQKNIAAHTSTPAQQNANRKAHGLPPLPVAKPKSTVPAGYHSVHVPDPRSDPDYMAQHAALQNQLAQYRTNQQHDLQQYDQTFAQNEQNIGFNTAANKGKGAWNLADLTPGTLGAAQRDTSNDYSARGMGYSTPYTVAAQNMNNDYSRRQGALATGRAQNQQTNADELNQYTNSNAQQDATALRTSIGNISAGLGIPSAQVRAGTSRNINVKNP